MFKYSVVFSIVTALFCSSAIAAAAPPPVEAFGQLPMVQSVKLSPGGTHYAAIQTYKGAKVLTVYDMYGTPGENVKVLTFEGRKKLDEELSRIFWVNDTRLVAVLEIPAYRGGTGVVETRMVAMDSDLRNKQMIPKARRATKSKFELTSGRVAQLQDRVLHTLPNDRDNILIELDREGNGWELQVYKLDVYTGGLKRVVSGKDSKIGGYETDADGDVRIRYRYRVNQRDFITELKDKDKSGWRKILDDNIDGLGGYSALAFSKDSNRLFVSSKGSGGRQEIHVLDLPSSKVIRTVFSNDKIDAGGVRLDEAGSVAVGVWYVDHYPRATYFDSAWKRAAEAVDKLLPGNETTLVSRDSAGQKWAVLSSNGNEPGTWFLYLKNEARVVEIARKYPLLKGRQLMPVEPFEFVARDGLAIPGYLTRPVGPGPYATVVMPHGGPNSRDTMAFNYRVQFLVSRGYAVLQPNFRGSTGYGKEFEEAGHHQWGLAMQDDLTDGALALIAQGIADPQRICIVGSSYGGYAALMGAVKTSDLYQCAASFGGVSDVKKLLAHWGAFKFNDGNDPRIGDRWDDSGRLRDTSPANNVDAIAIPILLMHGENDRVVPVDQSKLMAKRLKKENKPYKLVIFEGGDHNLSFEKNRIRALTELEAFLEKHIGN